MLSSLNQFTVRGVSMDYCPDDNISVDENFSSLSVGDDIVFLYGRGSRCIKRIAGVPGSLISVYKLILIVDGKQYRLENEAQSLCWMDWSINGEVPEDNLVVMGSGPLSIDSKRFGFLPFNQIIGKVIKDK